MLKSLRIQNVALIDELQIAFQKGFHILTGETGAGKSIIIDAVNFVLGERAHKDIIKSGTNKATVEACFEIENCGRVKEALTEYEIDFENEIIISRELSQSGKNTCRINGTLVNIALLKSITDLLVDIHGQHEHQSLLHQDAHIRFLDHYDPALLLQQQVVAGIYKEQQDIETQLKSSFLPEEERLRRLDILQYQINEIAQANLQLDEEKELEAQLRILSNAQTILLSLEETYQAFTGEQNGALSPVHQAVKHLEQIEHMSEAYASLYVRIQDAYYQIEDLAFTVRDLKENFDYQPETLQMVEERLSLIHNLQRKYGKSIPDILNYAKKMQKEYDHILNSGDHEQALKQKLFSMRSRYAEEAKTLSGLRKKSARKLEEEISLQLQELNMPKARFAVQISEASESAAGCDKVEFLLSTNAGEPLKSLQRVASGGELSRIMLAFKTVQNGMIPTIIFDEIDSGISGQAATAVGNKLMQIGEKHQVICITHLPQIAALADLHFLIEKHEKNGTTFTTLTTLNKAQRAQELARIMGADPHDEKALAHAKSLLSRSKK